MFMPSNSSRDAVMCNLCHVSITVSPTYDEHDRLAGGNLYH